MNQLPALGGIPKPPEEAPPPSLTFDLWKTQRKEEGTGEGTMEGASGSTQGPVCGPLGFSHEQKHHSYGASANPAIRAHP